MASANLHRQEKNPFTGCQVSFKDEEEKHLLVLQIDSNGTKLEVE